MSCWFSDAVWEMRKTWKKIRIEINEKIDDEISWLMKEHCSIVMLPWIILLSEKNFLRIFCFMIQTRSSSMKVMFSKFSSVILFQFTVSIFCEIKRFLIEWMRRSLTVNETRLRVSSMIIMIAHFLICRIWLYELFFINFKSLFSHFSFMLLLTSFARCLIFWYFLTRKKINEKKSSKIS